MIKTRFSCMRVTRERLLSSIKTSPMSYFERRRPIECVRFRCLLIDTTCGTDSVD